MDYTLKEFDLGTAPINLDQYLCKVLQTFKNMINKPKLQLLVYKI